MSSSVFEDLGFDRSESIEHGLRVKLAVYLKRFITDEGLTQEEAKELFGVPQPTISKIVRLDLRNISLTYLLRMVMTAGLSFQLGSDGSPASISVRVGKCKTATSEADVVPARAPSGPAPWSDPSTMGVSFEVEQSSVVLH